MKLPRNRLFGEMQDTFQSGCGMWWSFRK